MGNAHCTVSNQSPKPISVITFNMTDMLTKFYKTLYIVEPGESMVVEANADAVGLRLGIVYDALDNRDILFYRFSCNNESTLTVTSVDTKVIQHYGDNTTQNSNGKLSNFSATPFQLIVSTLNTEAVRTRSASQAPPPSSPSNPRADFVRMRRNSVLTNGSFDETIADGTSATPAADPDELPALYQPDLPQGVAVSVAVPTILEASTTLAAISQVILTNNAIRADQAFPASLFEDFLVLNATLTSVAAFYKTCVVHTGTQVAAVDLVYFTELIVDATKFSSDSTRDIKVLKRRYRYLFSADTIKVINKKLIDELLLPLTVRAATNVSIHLKESEDQTRAIIGKLAASMDQVILDMCSESMQRLKADSSSPAQMFRKRSQTRDAPEPGDDPVLVSLQSRVGHACQGVVDGAPCTKCQEFGGFSILAKFTPLSPQSTKCSYCSCDVSCHSGPKVDKAFLDSRAAAEEAAFAAQPHSSLGAQRRQSILQQQATPQKADPTEELHRAVGRKCTNTVDGSPCDKCAGFGFEIQPRFTPLSPQSTKCGLCSCDVSCHDGPVEVRA